MLLSVSSRMASAAVLGAVMLAAPWAGRASSPADVMATALRGSATTRKAFPAVADQENLHNAHVVTDKLISGAQPEGDASFALLKEMGVKTIISVDGAVPDV